MKSFFRVLEASVLFAIGIQLLFLWSELVSGKVENIDYSQWMVILSYVGSACILSAIRHILNGETK